MTERAKTKAARGKAKPAEVPSILELEYSLAGLPSAQHRAGLAGLVLMMQWLDQQHGDVRQGTCSVKQIDEMEVVIEIDEAGLGTLLDAAYEATESLQEYPAPWKNKPPVKEIVKDVPEKNGKVKQKTFYLYPKVEPGGAWLARAEKDGDGNGPWIGLWRRMLWETLRGVPAQRAPFEERANKRPTGLAAAIWKDLVDPGNPSVKLPSTYYIGAQANTADNVEFFDRARDQLLLHFWPFVAQVYVPTVVVPPEGKIESRPYALVIPDVSMLQSFCEVLQDDLRARNDKKWGIWPRDAMVDLPIEAALHFATRLRRQLERKQGATGRNDYVLGYEVHHVCKEGNNVRVAFSGRLEAPTPMVQRYGRLREEFLDASFRRTMLLNLVYERPDHVGFDKLFATSSYKKTTIGSPWFCHDARRFFEIAKAKGIAMTEKNKPDDDEDDENGGTETSKAKDNSLEGIILDVVRAYVKRRLESKYKLVWKEVKDNPKSRQDFAEKQEKLAKDAFLAVRGRPDNDFREYFAGTLCSVPQFLDSERYRILSHALRNEPSRVRTLTLLALSAASYSSLPKSKES